MVCAVSATACHLLFELDNQPASDASVDGLPDVGPPVELVVAHLAEPVLLGTGTWDVLDGVVDTSANVITDPSPGVEHEIVTPIEGGPVMVVRARTMSILGPLRVTGDKPLILVADEIVVGSDGVIDVAGRLDDAGPGAATGRAGQPGQNFNSNTAGGGGGGFGTPGANGASAGSTCAPIANGGGAGDEHGAPVLAILEGGGSGGAGGGDAACATAGGGGGGAVQLSARSRILVTGAIDAGGGGGRGGVVCPGHSSHAGGGGGAGGAIYLEAPMVDLMGTVTANGGGGGGGGSTPFANTLCDGFAAEPGGNGENGTRTIAAAAGGMRARQGCSHPGGAGGARTTAPTTNLSINCEGSVGGGGGAAGRIVIKSAQPILGTVSPAPTVIED